jgi:S1-C subfamily serine protease
MRLRVPIFAALAALLTSFAVAQEPRCSSSAQECDVQIRQMMSTGRRYLGLNVVDLKPGLIVKSVLPNSPAARGGILANDRLVAVNGRSLLLSSAMGFKEVLAGARQTGRLWVIVQRRGAYRKIDVRLEAYPKEHIDKAVAAHLQRSHNLAPAGAH